MADIVLVNPRFDVSYWGCEHALPLFGKRANVPTACLPLLAALTPPEHQVTLIDENVEPIDFARLAAADIVGVTGMNVQRTRMHEILASLNGQEVMTVVGGPWASVSENDVVHRADVIFVGEAEETWPHFLQDWLAGRQRKRYEQPDKTNMTQVPVPRYDLLDMKQYMFGSTQFSRGCPFQCEFCDIIVTFGRRPRWKSVEQIIAELDALVASGMEIAFIVDDNLIGDRKSAKDVLRHVVQWQEAHGYPLAFFTEASLDLADDCELMSLMVEANIQTVFVGVESPNESSLREAKKLQNLRQTGSLVEKIHTIQGAGLDVWCGMILGFDHDDTEVFAAHRQFIDEARILHAMVGMLTAIPKTPLFERLELEGRLCLNDDDQCGTNIVPLRMTREQLTDGYVRLMQDIYAPEPYFRRLEALFLQTDFRFGRARENYWKSHPAARLRAYTTNCLRCIGLYWRLMRCVPDESLRKEYRRRVRRLLIRRRDPMVLLVYLIKCAVHYHYYTMTQKMATRRTAVVNTF